MKCPWCKGSGMGSMMRKTVCKRCGGSGTVKGEPKKGDRVRIIHPRGYTDVEPEDEGTVRSVGLDEEPGFSIDMDGPFPSGVLGHQCVFRREDIELITTDEE